MFSSSKNTDKKYLGIDVGGTNIGLAFGASGLTMPLRSVNGKDLPTAFDQIVRTSFENKVNVIVVGLPVLETGKSSNQTLLVKSFVKQLKTHVKIPVVVVNEFMSTRNALANALAKGVSKKDGGLIDCMAAEVILKRYFEENGVK